MPRHFECSPHVDHYPTQGTKRGIDLMNAEIACARTLGEERGAVERLASRVDVRLERAQRCAAEAAQAPRKVLRKTLC